MIGCVPLVHGEFSDLCPGPITSLSGGRLIQSLAFLTFLLTVGDLVTKNTELVVGFGLGLGLRL